MELNHHIMQALRANNLMKRDVDYVVNDGEVIIVDEFTGRLMYGRRYSNGLHQAIEARKAFRPQRVQDAGHHHAAELFPYVQQAGRHDRYGRKRKKRNSAISITWTSL